MQCSRALYTRAQLVGGLFGVVGLWSSRFD